MSTAKQAIRICHDDECFRVVRGLVASWLQILSIRGELTLTVGWPFGWHETDRYAVNI